MYPSTQSRSVTPLFVMMVIATPSITVSQQAGVREQRFSLENISHKAGPATTVKQLEFDTSGSHEESLLSSLLKEVNLLHEMEDYRKSGWDGEDAAAIAADSINAAKDILSDLLALGMPAPATAPGADGSVCMEWVWRKDDKEGRAFLDIGPEKRTMIFRELLSGDKVERHFETYTTAAKAFILSSFKEIRENIQA